MIENANIEKLISGLRSDMPDTLIEGNNHPYTCKCNACLQWWVLVGPEPLDIGRWGFGPFSEEEFLAAGGYIPDEVEEEGDEVDSI